MGEYDMVVVVEAPDNAAAAKALIGMGAQGKCEHHHNGGAHRARVQKPYLRDGLTLKPNPSIQS